MHSFHHKARLCRKRRGSVAGYRLGPAAGLCLLLLTQSVRAADERATLVMIGFLDAVDESHDTYASVRAGISDLNAEVRAVWRATSPALSDALPMAKAVAEEHRALAVFWRRRQQLFLFVPELDGTSLLVRPVGHTAAEGTADTVGLIVRSALASLLSGKPDAATVTSAGSAPPSDQVPDNGAGVDRAIFSAVPQIPIPPPTTGEGTTAPLKEGDKAAANPAVAPDDATPPPGAAPAETPDNAPGAAPALGADRAAANRTAPKAAPSSAYVGRRLLMELLYGLDTVGRSHPAIHGARFTLGARLVQRLYLTVDYTFSGPPIKANVVTTDDEEAGTLTLTRHPVSVGARWIILEKRRWRIGGGLLMEMDIMKESIKVSSPSSGIQRARTGENKTQLGIVPVAVAGLHLIGPLYAGLHLGMRILPWRIAYKARLDGKEKLLYVPWRLQLRLSVGLEVIFF